MNVSKKLFIMFVVSALVSTQVASAFEPKETAKYFNGPTVSSVTDTTAQVSLSGAVLGGISEDEKAGIYFEYIEKDLVCIAIYPTPAACLPQKTELGKTDVTLKNLKPNTTYTVLYKRDNTIRCITTPCPGNEFQSLSVEFTTKKEVVTTGISKNLFLGTRGEQVKSLQTILINGGYLRGTATGYFGYATLQSVKSFQRAHDIRATGFVGPQTRRALDASINISPEVGAEKFEGIITAYSTACFADGECSITVDGKKVVTTLGWTQMTVGAVTGVPDFGSVGQKIGSRAHVYAKKTDDGYTLYGSTEYYVRVE
jgi:hypothetical protein